MIESAHAVIEEKFGGKISISTLKREAKKAGLVWKKVKKTLKNKRNQKIFSKVEKRLADLVEKKSKREIDLYYDESGLKLAPYTCTQGSVSPQLNGALRGRRQPAGQQKCL